MLGSLQLLAPALIPSWRFFDVITASPRIEVAWLDTEDGRAEIWQEFRPRPHSLRVTTVLRRMVWNPRWNEMLFLTSCAERLLENPTQHSVDALYQRISSSLAPQALRQFFQFRVILLSRSAEGERLESEVAYVSSCYAIADAV